MNTNIHSSHLMWVFVHAEGDVRNGDSVSRISKRHPQVTSVVRTIPDIDVFLEDRLYLFTCHRPSRTTILGVLPHPLHFEEKQPPSAIEMSPERIRPKVKSIAYQKMPGSFAQFRTPQLEDKLTCIFEDHGHQKKQCWLSFRTGHGYDLKYSVEFRGGSHHMACARRSGMAPDPLANPSCLGS